MRFALPAVFAATTIAAAACGGGVPGTGVGASSTSTSTSTSTSSGSTSSTSGSSSGATAAQACAAMEQAVCTFRDHCSPSKFLNTKTYGSDALCESLTTPTCLKNLSATGQGNTPANTEACAAAYDSQTCTNFFDDDPVAACATPAGTVAFGSPCGASGQCTTTWCAVSEYEVCGTCAAVPVAGATCQVIGDCGHNMGCAIPTAGGAGGGDAGAGGATSGTCVPFAAAGAMCLTGTKPCAALLACVADDEATSTMGTCQAQGTTVGAACDGSRATLANCSADMGLVCIPTAAGSSVGTCQNITLVAAGDPCGDVGSAPITGFADCTAGGLCKKATATATTGTCVAPAPTGGACNSDVTIGPGCLAPAKCVPTTAGATAGTCTLPNPANCK